MENFKSIIYAAIHTPFNWVLDVDSGDIFFVVACFEIELVLSFSDKNHLEELIQELEKASTSNVNPSLYLSVCFIFVTS